MKSIYLDYASITPVDPKVRKEMDKWNREPLNPSSIHSLGVKAKKAMEGARKGVAEFLNAHADEIVFTSGGTEANSLALEGAARAAFKNGISKPHLIISAIEHSSIIETANMLEKRGVEVTKLTVDKNGLVSLEQLKKSIKLETFMVSIVTANNEIGTIQPIREIAKIVRDARKKFESEAIGKDRGSLMSRFSRIVPGSAARVGENFQQKIVRAPETFPSRSFKNGLGKYPLFHTDACQAVLYQDLNVEKLGIDLLTLDASKAYGPRGVGTLFVKRGTLIEPIIYGGGQENGLRSGTENIPGIVGFARALELIKKTEPTKNNKKVVNFSDVSKEGKHVGVLRNYFEREVKKIRSDAIINAANTPRTPHISNITFPDIDGEMLVLRLDAKGIAVSTKSACLKDEDESYVLRAIGADSKSSIRFSFGKWTKMSDIKKTLNILKKLLS
jgi:cysteine desulfurase